MTTERPAVPRELEREVLLEAGHRCAIPTCKQTIVEIAHIVRYRDEKSHKFDNLIALCPTCHSRYDREEFDRKSMTLYKYKLSIVNNRYKDLEEGLLQYFGRQP
jgi:5-methylcytosine-specific restriction endonuclease McrA